MFYAESFYVLRVLFYCCTDFVILMLTHDVENIYVLRSDIHRVKYAKTRASSDAYFPVYDSVFMLKNTNTILSTDRKTRVRNIPHSGIFYAGIRKK